MPEVDSELYKLITVSGPDALAFLQGQLTQDIGRVAGGDGLLAAWCNAKGRVVVIIRLVDMDDAIGLVVPAGMAVRVIQRLNLYRLRSKVEFSAPGDDWRNLIDARLTDPLALIQAGIPTIDEANTEAYTPHMLNLDKLGAISFSKGCYTGQEVVARTEHLGKSKRRLMRYQADHDGISVGDKLSDGEREVGTVVNVAGSDLLAVTPVDLHERALTMGALNVVPESLPYEL
jgi:folate-binding protein YgfZ